VSGAGTGFRRGTKSFVRNPAQPQSTRAGDLEVEHRILAGARSDRSDSDSRSGTGDHARRGETYGPLVPTLPGKFNMGTPVSLDVPHSYRGLLVLVNRGRDPVTLDGAGLAGPGSGISYVRAFVVHLPSHPVPCDALAGRARWWCVQTARIGSSTATASPGTADGSRVR
jgi:hypothetical protein